MKEKRKMKKACIALVAVMMAAATLVPAAQALEVSGDAYVGYYDKYLWRGFDLSGGMPVVQGGVDLSTAGFTLSYWSNYQARDDEGAGFESGEVNETDITLNYSANLNDLVSVSVGNILYALEGLNDTNELYGKVALNTLLAPSVTIFWDYDEAEEDGYFVSAAIGHTFGITDKLGVSAGAAVNYNGASDYAVGNYHDWHNYELSVGASYAVTDNFSVSPSFLFSSGLSDEAKAKIDSEILAGLKVALTF
jgi:uncharacterized protein (TIGR02001 family)